MKWLKKGRIIMKTLNSKKTVRDKVAGILSFYLKLTKKELI